MQSEKLLRPVPRHLLALLAAGTDCNLCNIEEQKRHKTRISEIVSEHSADAASNDAAVTRHTYVMCLELERL